MKRLPLDENGIIVKLNAFDTTIVLDLTRSSESIASLTIHFPYVIPQSKLNELEDQWRSIVL